MEMVLNKLIEYFDQQLRMQRESSIKYTGEEAFFDALDVCKNAQKSYTPPPPVQSDSGVEGKILQMAMARHPVSKSKMIAYKEGLEHGYQLTEPKTKELEDALSNLNEIADCTNGRLREMAETAANKITKALNPTQ